MNNYRGAKLLSAQAKMVRQMMGLHWWKVATTCEDDDNIEKGTNNTSAEPHAGYGQN